MNAAKSIAAIALALTGACSGPAKNTPETTPSSTVSAVSTGEASNANARLLDRLDEAEAPLAEVAAEVAKTGDDLVIREGVRRLIARATKVSSQRWRDEKRKDVENLEIRLGRIPSAVTIDEKTLEAQTAAMAPIIAALDVLATPPAIELAFREAGDVALPVKRRALSLELLKHHVNANDPAQGPRLAALATEIDRKLEAAKPGTSAAADAAMVIGMLREQLADCYNKALEKDAKLRTEGKLDLTMSPDGHVEAAHADGLSPKELAACVEALGLSAKFAPRAQGTPAQISIPLSFKPDQ